MPAPTGAAKVHEGKMRRAAVRQGLMLHRMRSKDARALGHGCYWLESKAGEPVFGMSGEGYPTATIEAIEAYLTGDRP